MTTGSLILRCLLLGDELRSGAAKGIRYRGSPKRPDLDDRVLVDGVPLFACRYDEIDAPAALHKVMIAKPERPNEREDIAALSAVVHAIPDERWCRVYACDDEKLLALKSLW
jgi:hypothetical protein